MAEGSGVDVPVLTPEGAAMLLRYLSITAGAADEQPKKRGPYKKREQISN